MKLLYVRKQITDPWWKRWPKYLRDWYKFHHREGFFRASIYKTSKVRQLDFTLLKKMPQSYLKTFDAIIFNQHFNVLSKGSAFETCLDGIQEVKNKLKNLLRVLLIPTANAKNIGSDELLDNFHLVFKREPFKDLSRYDLQNKNRDKIYPTILSCPLVPATILNYNKIKPANFGFEHPSSSQNYDVFFSGTHTSDPAIHGKDIRREITKFISESKIDFHGGLQPKNKELPQEIIYPRLKQDEFYEKTRNSKINLALDGYGQFTYRHWELWSLSSFMISSPSINKLWLPFHFEENKHFVTYKNKSDLLKKINYYLRNEKKRAHIAKNGRKLFEREYDFTKHGRDIKKKIAKNL